MSEDLCGSTVLRTSRYPIRHIRPGGSKEHQISDHGSVSPRVLAPEDWAAGDALEAADVGLETTRGEAQWSPLAPANRAGNRTER